MALVSSGAAAADWALTLSERQQQQGRQACYYGNQQQDATTAEAVHGQAEEDAG